MITAKEAREKALKWNPEKLEEHKRWIAESVAHVATQGGRAYCYSVWEENFIPSLLEWLKELGYEAFRGKNRDIEISW